MEVLFFFVSLCFLLPSAAGGVKAVNGGYSPWSEFSECSESCGGGVRIRARSCNSPEPGNGGKDCGGLGPEKLSKACNKFPCPVNGGYSTWSKFTDCSLTCGGGYRMRTRKCDNPLPCCGGKNCEKLGPNVETESCGSCPCVVDGGYSGWCSYGSCNVTCGGGVRIRRRVCTDPPPQNGGETCDHLGPSEETIQCNTNSCPGTPGNYTGWTPWSECDVTCGGGVQSRSRNCTNPPPADGGKKCVDLGPANQTQECNPDPCPTDGNYTGWTTWSECSVSCGGAVQSRSRNCTNPPPANGGKSCEDLGPANQTQKCNIYPCPPPCSAGLDIGIVLDKSNSLTPRHINEIFDLIVDLPDQFNPSPDGDQFGFITFNNETKVEFTFADDLYHDKAMLKWKINNTSRTRAFKTRTDLALIAARDKLFTAEGGDRPDKPNVMLFITDGKPTHQPMDFKKFAASYHSDPKVKDLYTVAVGIGDKANLDILHVIAGENGNVILVHNFDQLASHLTEIKDKVCD